MIKNEEDALIELSKIIDLIRSQEEEFIFFVNLASSKIINYVNKTEYYYSLVFLNEILDKNLKEKEFIIIWRSLYNIFFNNLEFKHIFDKEENLFDILFINYIMYEIMSRFANLIDIEDYYQLLENYLEIDNHDILFQILEHNDKFIEKLMQSIAPFKKDKVFELNIQLILRVVDFHVVLFKNYKSQVYLQKIIQTLGFLKGLFSIVDDFGPISGESIMCIGRIFKTFYENNILTAVLDQSQFSEIVSIVIEKLTKCLPKINDDKWELFVFMLEFLLKCVLIENETIQIQYVEKLHKLIESSVIPIFRFKDIYNQLSSFYNSFLNLKLKHENLWIKVFIIFKILLSNNEELYNSTNDIEILWSLFIKKYLISYVDHMKRMNKKDENLKQILAEILVKSNVYLY
jgi:hypothetical protein